VFDHQVELYQQYLMGIRLPTVTALTAELSVQFGFGGTSAQTDKAMRRFVEVLPLLAETAELENSVIPGAPYRCRSAREFDEGPDKDKKRRRPSNARNAQDAAGFLVARFQVERDRHVIRQPNRQRRQFPADGQRMCPHREARLTPDFTPAARHAIRGRRRIKRRVRAAQQLQQIAVEIESSNRHQIDDRHANVLLEQSRTLGGENAAIFGPVLVGGADDFDGRH